MLTLGCTENSRYDTRPVWHRFAKLFTLQLVELSLESWVCLQKSVSAIADVCNFECVCRQTDYLCDFWVTLITCNYCIYCQVGRIVDVLKDKRSHHNGFPVVDCLDSNDKEVNFLCFFLWFHEIGRKWYGLRETNVVIFSDSWHNNPHPQKQHCLKEMQTLWPNNFISANQSPA